MTDKSTVAATMRGKLETAFSPISLDIINESHLHSGHAGSPGTGHSHFRVTIVSEDFRGLSRVACHRRVNDVLSDELNGVIHALALTTAVPA